MAEGCLELHPSLWQIPRSYVCPLSLELMVDPVMVDPEGGQGGNTYERERIATWFRQGHKTDPLTNLRLKSTKLTENLAVRGAILEFKDKNVELAAAIEDLARKLHLAQAVAESAAQAPSASVPFRFMDRITNSIMKQPVSARDGFVYEQRVLLAHFRDCAYQGKQLTSPVTKEPMEAGYDPETALAAEIKTFLDRTFGSMQDMPALVNHGSVLDLSILFSALDGLKDVLVETLGAWTPPHLVVFGGESVGKSSVLQRLSLLPFFPTNNTRCTRMPIRVEVRRAATHSPATLSVWDVRTKSYVGEPQLISLETSDQEINTKMMSVLETHGGGARVSMDFELHIRATSTILPPMNLVDLPGIIESDPELKNQTETLFARYVTEPDSKDIFLAVVPAVGVGPANWTATRLVLQHQLMDRTIGVITNCDRIQEDEVGLLRTWLTGSGTDGLLLLEPHGYVAVANVKRISERRPDESYAEWMRRKAQRELQTFADLNMSDCVNANSVSIQALMERINSVYSWHVIHSWLPSTASRLLQIWSDCCEELLQLGLPRASGMLEAAALAQFTEAATAEAKRRLDFLVGRAKALFWASSAKPMKDYLEKEFERLAQVPLELVGVSRYLQDSVTSMCRNLPVTAVQEEWLEQAMFALESPVTLEPFQLQRLPRFVNKLRRNLEENKPELDTATFSKNIRHFLDKVFCPSSSTTMTIKVDEAGHAKLFFDTEKIVGVCLHQLAASFKALETNSELEARVIIPALVEQEQETCHQSRQRVYDRMGRSANALQMLIETHWSSTHPEGVSDSTVPNLLDAKAEVLAAWWPDIAPGKGSATLHGNRQSDNSFEEAACNWVVSAMGKARRTAAAAAAAAKAKAKAKEANAKAKAEAAVAAAAAKAKAFANFSFRVSLPPEEGH
ncbi:unnamed protein product [Polarella glacialis]|uniref:U-box domain-containing protein n=1 Tax=Polarella glacialis TaxID=89957 RepID=A0A813JU86_POLGL|nr:unnamed protein product [Polarella glacialis]